MKKMSIKKIIVCLIILINLFFWVRLFALKPDPKITISDSPIVMIEHRTDKADFKEIVEEKYQILKQASEVFPFFQPNIKNANFVIDSDVKKFSSYNMIFSEQRDTFLSNTAVLEKSNLDDNSAISILDDSSNQLFAELYPNQNYKVYAIFSDDNNSSENIIINKKTYSFEKVSENIYLLNSFQVGDFYSAGIQATSKNEKIQQVVFVTDEIILKKTDLKLLTNSDAKISKTNDKLNVSMPKNSYLVLNTDIASDFSKRPKNYLLNSFSTVSYNYNGNSDIGEKNLSRINIVESDGEYQIKSPDWKGKRDRYFIYSFLSFILTGLLLLEKKIAKLIRNFFDKHSFFLAEHKNEIIGAVIFTLLLFILDTSSIFGNYLNTTIIMLIIFLESLIICRFPKFVLILIMLFLFCLIIASHFSGHLYLTEKITKILYGFIIGSIVILSVQPFNNK